MPTIPLAALQATAPASDGLSATSTSATAVLPEVADGAAIGQHDRVGGQRAAGAARAGLLRVADLVDVDVVAVR